MAATAGRDRNGITIEPINTVTGIRRLLILVNPRTGKIKYFYNRLGAEYRSTQINTRPATLEENMFCSNCGTEIQAGAQFCPSCGQAAGQTAQGNPGVAAPAAPPKKKMAMWKKVVMGIAVVIGASIAAAFYFTSGLTEPVDRQIAALQKGDLQAAYEETSVAFKESTSFEDFTRFVQSNPILTKISGHTFSSRKIDNGIGYLSGKLTTEGGGVQPVAYRLVKENDTWKILSINFNPDE